MGLVALPRVSKEIHPSRSLWAKNHVPYLIDATAFPPGSPGEQSVLQAIQAWNGSGSANLAPRAGEPDYAVFRQHPTGCNSAVGKQGGEQSVFCALGAGFDAGSVIHEIGHCLGLMHEHQRPDRDGHATVDPSVTGDRDYRISDVGVAFGDYDCGSIMHYPNVPGRLTLAAACAALSQHAALSRGDIDTANWIRAMAGQNHRYTREGCSRRIVAYVGAAGEVPVLRGHAANVPVRKDQDNIDWYCRDPGNGKNDTDIAKGSSYISVIRYLGVDYLDIFCFS